LESLLLEDQAITPFLDEMHLCGKFASFYLHKLTGVDRALHGTMDRLKKRRGFNPFKSFFKQDDIQGWIIEQNQRLDDAFRTMIVRLG
jgi:hypothetical protein